MTAMNAMPPRASAAKGMQGADRVAAILLTMGKSLAGRLMKHFDPDEIKRITRSAADLKPVPAPPLGGLIEEFATQFALGASLVGNAGEVERLLDGVLPKDRSPRSWAISPAIPIARSGSASRPSPRTRSPPTSREHPQTAALILSKVTPATAAKVLAHIPGERRDSLVRRMLTMKPSSTRPCACWSAFSTRNSPPIFPRTPTPTVRRASPKS